MRPETHLQIDIIKELAKHGLRAVHVPNGAVLAGDARQRAIQVNALKRAGMLKGFPDLLVFGPQGRMGCIEVKVEGNRLTDDQMHVCDWMTAWGHLYAVCRSTADVAETLGKWGWV